MSQNGIKASPTIIRNIVSVDDCRCSLLIDMLLDIVVFYSTFYNCLSAVIPVMQFIKKVAWLSKQ